jgi:hypothetical protein
MPRALTLANAPLQRRRAAAPAVDALAEQPEHRDARDPAVREIVELQEHEHAAQNGGEKSEDDERHGRTAFMLDMRAAARMDAVLKAAINVGAACMNHLDCSECRHVCNQAKLRSQNDLRHQRHPNKLPARGIHFAPANS